MAEPDFSAVAPAQARGQIRGCLDPRLHGNDGKTFFIAALILTLFGARAQADFVVASAAEPPLISSSTVTAATPAPSEDIPPWLRWMIHASPSGMFLNLPSIATDPNRGVTYGVMPVLVVQRKDSDQIQAIHAPDLTYNDIYNWEPTYRYFYFPTTHSSLVLRGSYSKYEREAFADFQDQYFLGKRIDVEAMVWYNWDASQRFYGLGPASSFSGQINYTAHYLTARLSAGAAIKPDSDWRFRVMDNFISERAVNGPTPGLPLFAATYPLEASTGRQKANEIRAVLDYDSRDNQITPTKGALFQLYAGRTLTDVASTIDFSRYGFDTRYLYPWKGNADWVTAVQFQGQQMLGSGIPFWFLPSLGGKYSLRAYGDGRYIDRGMTSLNAEERIAFWDEKMGGVSAQFQVAPFAGVGTVFDSPDNVQSKYLRPVVGAAIRAVAPPQVVGSIDVGVGQEGVAVFMDINYSF